MVGALLPGLTPLGQKCASDALGGGFRQRIGDASRKHTAGVTAVALRRLGLVTAAAALAAAATLGMPAWLAGPVMHCPRHTSFAPPRSPTLWGRTPLSHSPGSVLTRLAKLDGEYGVMPEAPGPAIDTSEEEDPIWERLVVAVQAADNKRSVDITAFWINNGFEIVMLVTALSRPQLQAIAGEIEREMKDKLRLRRFRRASQPKGTSDRLRAEAAMGWCMVRFPRLTIHVMMPVQRSYYDLEGLWRDEWEDYEPIDLTEILREETFGNMRLKRELEPPAEGDGNYVSIDEAPGSVEEEVGDGPYQPYEGSDAYYEPEEDDPFWS